MGKLEEKKHFLFLFYSLKSFFFLGYPYLVLRAWKEFYPDPDPKTLCKQTSLGLNPVPFGGVIK